MASRIKGITVEIGGDTTGLQNAQEQAKAQLENGTLGQDKYDALQREIVETEQELQRLQQEAINSNETLCKIETAGQKFQTVGNTIAGVGQKFLPVTAAVGALGTTAVKTTADFDSSMSQVQATMGITKDSMSDLNGASVNTMDALRDLAKQMGAETAFSASECADAMNYLALAGYDTQEIYDTLPTVLNLAAAGDIDLASASDMVTDAMSALGMETSEADTMVDQMAKTASLTNTSVAQLGEGILTIGATARTVKGGTAELNTALGILANNGIKSAEGGTHLRNVILSLQNPTDKAAARMEALGISVYDSEGNMRSLNDILGDLNTSMEGMTAQEKSNIIGQIFNKTDLSAVNALLANTGDTWDSLQQSIADSGGAAQQMADTQLDNLSGQLTLLKSALEGLAISFGEILMPAIRAIVEKVQAFVDKLNSLDDAQKQTVVKIALIAAAIGPLLIAFGKTISTVGSVMTGFSTLTKGVAKLGVKLAGSTGSVTSLGSALGAVAGSVLAVVAIVAVLAAAFKHLWDTNEEFRNAITEIWEGIAERFAAFGDAVTQRLNALGFDFQNIVDVLKAVWDGFCQMLAPVFEAAFSVIGTVLGTVLDGITGLLDVFIGLFTGNWSQLWTGVKEIFSGIWNGITGVFSAALGMIQGIADTVLGWFGTSWNEVWTGISTFFANIWNGIVSFFTGVWETIKNVVQTGVLFIGSILEAAFDIITLPFRFIWENCRETITATWESIQSVVSGAVNAVSTTISTVMTAISTVISTVWTAIGTKISTVVNAIKTTVTTVFNAIKTVASTVWNGIKAAISTVVDGISSKVSSVFNSVKSTVSSVFNGIKSTATSVWNGIKSAITTPIEAAKNTVKSALDKISGFFSGCKLQLPHIKLPHFSISGSLSISPPSVPHLSVSWYKNGGIMTHPTIFGMNGSSLMAGGEAGAEAILPLKSFYDNLESILTNRLDMSGMEKYLAVIAANSSKGIYLEDGTLVGHLLPAIDSKLGRAQKLSRRLSL